MRRAFFIPTVLLILTGLFLSACSGLIPLDEEAVSGEYGPAASAQEQQLRTFDALWSHVQDTYIHYETSGTDWESLHKNYTAQIDSGLTQEEFIALMNELETGFPSGGLIYQSRAERVAADIAEVATYDGIGAFVGFQEEDEPHIVILGVIEGSPAAKAGLKAHDSIYSIDGSPILLEEGLGAVSRIRGPAGSSVTLDVQSPGQAQRSVQVTRAKLTTTGKLNAYNVPTASMGICCSHPLRIRGSIRMCALRCRRCPTRANSKDW